MPNSSMIRTLADLRTEFRRERKAKKLTQAEVAKRGGMRRETIIKLEAGGNVDALTLLKAIGALGKAIQLVTPPKLSFEEIQQMFDAEDPYE